MNRREARELLGLPPVYSAADVEAAYRARARHAHPDHGGTAEAFRAITESRRILLAGPAQTARVVAVDDTPALRRLLARLGHRAPAKRHRRLS